MYATRDYAHSSALKGSTDVQSNVVRTHLYLPGKHERTLQTAGVMPGLYVEGESKDLGEEVFDGPARDGCGDINVTSFERGRMNCGSPLGSPCFNYSRCTFHEHEIGPKVYVYDDHCSLRPSNELPLLGESGGWLKIDSLFRRAAYEMGILAETYESACFFIHVHKSTRRDEEPCATSAPLWNDGVNHVMVYFSDDGR